MQKASNKRTRRHITDPASLSSKQCGDSLKNLCEPGSPFAEEIHLRAKTITPLLKEILDYRPRPHWR
jgi:hypothetical protein